MSAAWVTAGQFLSVGGNIKKNLKYIIINISRWYISHYCQLLLLSKWVPCSFTVYCVLPASKACDVNVGVTTVNSSHLNRWTVQLF